jgi:hypothetical protein
MIRVKCDLISFDVMWSDLIWFDLIWSDWIWLNLLYSSLLCLYSILIRFDSFSSHRFWLSDRLIHSCAEKLIDQLSIFFRFLATLSTCPFQLMMIPWINDVFNG